MPSPGAKLFALKIFGDNALGSTGLVLDALEWCVDPNADDKFDDRMDVINLSLGSTLGLEEKHEIEAEVFRNLTNLGCVVVAAAGCVWSWLMVGAFLPGCAKLSAGCG